MTPGESLPLRVAENRFVGKRPGLLPTDRALYLGGGYVKPLP